jgi:ribose/xylose/arabinose/galactoside ABC-type transport system permease subunit
MDEKWVYYAMLVVMLILLIAVELWDVQVWARPSSIGQAEQAAACMGVNVNAVKYIPHVQRLFHGLAGHDGHPVDYVDSRTAQHSILSCLR